LSKPRVNLVASSKGGDGSLPRPVLKVGPPSLSMILNCSRPTP
jgi:hypothetical protein